MSRASISIVIPAKNSGATLDACLESIRGQEYSECEVIVVDAASRDSTREVASRYGCRIITAEAGAPESRNIGFSMAKGDIFLSIDSDMVLEKGLLDDISARMGGNGALVIPEHGTGRSWLSKLKALEKSLYLNDPAMESARAFTRKAFESAGGYDKALRFGEDRDIHCRIASSFGIGRTGRGVLHDTDCLTLAGDLRKFHSYGRSARRFVSKGNAGASGIVAPSRFLFAGKWGKMARTPLESAGLVALKLLESAAFGLGMARSLISA
jgi:glycosyltransferase involved in cell wall biosynthesis